MGWKIGLSPRDLTLENNFPALCIGLFSWENSLRPKGRARSEKLPQIVGLLSFQRVFREMNLGFPGRPGAPVLAEKARLGAGAALRPKEILGHNKGPGLQQQGLLPGRVQQAGELQHSARGARGGRVAACTLRPLSQCVGQRQGGEFALSLKIALLLRVTMSDLLSSQERPWNERESLFNKKLRD